MEIKNQALTRVEMLAAIEKYDEEEGLIFHLRQIIRTGDGYTLEPGSRAFFVKYLARYGFRLENLTTADELLEAIGFCNNEDFVKVVKR